MEWVKQRAKSLLMFLSKKQRKKRYAQKWVASHRKAWKNDIKNKDVSIICSTCIGGVIYHDLGLKFLSPTINMYMHNLDFIKFACNLKHYCSLKLSFIETDESFPVAMCGDIRLNFNHSKTAEEAESNWERRKQRINHDNLFLIFYYRDGFTVEQIREIEKADCKGKAVLTHKPLGLNYEVYMHGNGDPEQNFLEEDMYGIRSFEKEWDFVSWLNGNNSRLKDFWFSIVKRYRLLRLS